MSNSCNMVLLNLRNYINLFELRLCMIVAGSASLGLAKRVADGLGEKLVTPEQKTFPDGEAYLRIEERVEGDVIIVQSTHLPYRNLVELFLLIDLVKRLGAKRIACLVPYLVHARQDKEFDKGEALSAETIFKILKSLGVDYLVTVDLHLHREEGPFTAGGIAAYNVTASDLIVEHMTKKHGPLIVITPDQGSAAQARKVGGQALVKSRKDSETVDIVGVPPLEGKKVLLLDDMITTAGTMCKALELVRKAGAIDVMAGATHGVFCEGSLGRVLKLTDSVVCADTITTPLSKVSVAPKVVEVLKKWKR